MNSAGSDFKYGVALIVSGVSGSGKTTACKMLLESEPNLFFSISCTTREPRRQELNGRDYWFIDEQSFREKVRAGAFLEYAEVHGSYYGTLREQAVNNLAEGRDLLLDVDVEGGRQLRRAGAGTDFGGCAVDVFFAPPSLTEAERRLRQRGTEDEQVLARRLGNAAAELAAWREYRYLVVNEDLEQAVQGLRAILHASRQLVSTYRKPPWED